MSNYIEDRKFTDYIHNIIAVPNVYAGIGWEELKLDDTQLSDMDIRNGVDYIFRDKKGNVYTVQERFRESKYEQYSDFTIRYRRDDNPHPERVESEYYKLNANYFTYGITNCTKKNLSVCTQFKKVAIIDLKKVYEKIDSKQIVIRDNKEKTCRIEEGKIICPILYNRDHSSSFFPIEISYLIKLWGEDIILYKEGF